MDMTPNDFFILQWRHNRKKEDKWEIAREMIAASLNPHTKNRISGKDIIELQKDREDQKWEIDEELSRKIMKNLN